MIISQFKSAQFGMLALGILFAIFLLLNYGCGQTTEDEIMSEAPVAEKIPKELILHGDTRIDNYYWLNQRENPKVIAYLEAENKYKETMMESTETLQADLFEEATVIPRVSKAMDAIKHKYGEKMIQRGVI